MIVFVYSDAQDPSLYRRWEFVTGRDAAELNVHDSEQGAHMAS